jgi:hypothetical protein
MANKAVHLNDAVPYIMNNIQVQKKRLDDNGHCSIIFLSGPPGIGKSDLLEQVAKELNMGLNAQYLGTMLIEQFGMPLPTLEKDATFQKWSNPSFYSTEDLRIHPPTKNDGLSLEDPSVLNVKAVLSDGVIILFLDDIHLATKTIQSYLFQLFTYRSIHNKKMPQNFVMVAAGNRSIDRANAQPIMAPIANRMYFLDVDAESSDWITNFAIPNQLREDIVSFIGLYPDMLQSDPLESKAWASPRSWTYLCGEMDQWEIGKTLEVDNILTMGGGHVGVDYTAKFVEYVKLFKQWDIESYFRGAKLPMLKPTDKIKSYTLMSAMSAELIKSLRDNNWVIDKIRQRNIDVTKELFVQMLDRSIELVPMGLRNILLAENLSGNEALVYCELTKDNPALLKAVKELMS